jgi:hypothetical protein
LFKIHNSWVPLIGGVSGILGALVSPVETIRHLWWLPLLLDFGCIPGFLYTLVVLLFYRTSKTQQNNPHDTNTSGKDSPN